MNGGIRGMAESPGTGGSTRIAGTTDTGASTRTTGAPDTSGSTRTVVVYEFSFAAWPVPEGEALLFDGNLLLRLETTPSAVAGTAPECVLAALEAPPAMQMPVHTHAQTINAGLWVLPRDVIVDETNGTLRIEMDSAGELRITRPGPVLLPGGDLYCTHSECAYAGLVPEQHREVTWLAYIGEITAQDWMLAVQSSARPPELIDSAEVAALLGITVKSLRNLRSRNPSFPDKVGADGRHSLFDRVEVHRWIGEHRG